MDGAACSSGILPAEAWDTGASKEDQALARAICRAACPCLRQCRQYALGPSGVSVGGIAGGLSEGERQVIRRNRKQAAGGLPCIKRP